MQEGEVWAPDATHGFIRGTVVEIGSDTLTVQTPDNAVSLDLNSWIARIFI